MAGFGGHAREVASLFGALARNSLPAWPRRSEVLAGQRLSTLTPDGTPLEVSVALDNNDHSGLRYATEVSDPLAPLEARLRQAARAIETALSWLGNRQHSGLHRRLLALVASSARPKDRFLVWAGFAHGPASDVLKAYYRLDPQSDEGPLISVLDEARRIHALGAGPDRMFAAACAWGRPVITCLETGRDGTAPKFKFYARPLRPEASADNPAAFAAIDAAGFVPVYKTVRAVLGAGGARGHQMAPRLACFGAGQTGMSLNLYFPLARHVDDDGAASDLVRRLAHSAGLGVEPYERLLGVLRAAAPMATDTGQVSLMHTSVALGFERHAMRLTPYLKPCWSI
jgi:hypothetical protein